MADDTVLQQALRPFESVPGVKTAKNLIQVEEAVAGPDRNKYESALETESKRAAEMKTKQAQMEAEKQKGITSALEAEKTGLETDKDVAEARNISEGRHAFVPTQQTAGDLGALFAITNLLGFAIGRGGKGPAQAALSAQNGMLEGYQKGNMDVYKREKEIFETNQKELDRKLNDLLKFAEQNAKVRAVNKELGEQQANQKYAEEGASFIAELEKKYGPEKSIEFLKSIKEKADQRAKIITTEIEEERKFKQQKELKEIERQNQLSNAYKDVRGEMLGLNTTFGLPQNDIAKLGPKEISYVSSNLEAAKLTKKLADEVRDYPNAAGVAGKFFSGIDKYLPDNYNTSDSDVGASLLKNASNSFSDPNLSEPEMSKVREIIKLGVDVVNARASAASGGGRTLVSELKMQSGVVGLEGMSSKTAVDVYNNLAERDIDKIRTRGVSEEGVNSVKQKISNQQQTTPTTSSSKPTPTDEDRKRGRSNPDSRQNFIRYFGVEP